MGNPRSEDTLPPIERDAVETAAGEAEEEDITRRGTCRSDERRDVGVESPQTCAKGGCFGDGVRLKALKQDPPGPEVDPVDDGGGGLAATRAGVKTGTVAESSWED